MGVVTIRPEEYQGVGKETKSVRGLSIELSLSPYDLPREVEGRLDKATAIFHIFFRYLDQEEAVPKRLNDTITMKIGKNSGKILGFEIQVEKLGIQEIAVQITHAVQSEIPHLTKFNQKANFEVIRSVLDRNKDSIFSEAALTA